MLRLEMGRSRVTRAEPLETGKQRARTILSSSNLLGERARHHTVTRHDYKEKRLLVLKSHDSSVSCGDLTGWKGRGSIRLLKLLSGVAISTRPVNKLGNDGNPTERISLIKAAVARTINFRRSNAIIP